MWPVSSDKYWWNASAGTGMNQIAYYTRDTATKHDLRDMAHFRNMETTAYTLISILNKTHPSLTEEDRDDITHIQDLLYILEMNGHPMIYNDWSAMIASEFLLDQYLYRGMFIGYDTTAAAPGFQLYPRPDDMNENVEFRWMGEWDEDLAKGMVVPLCVLHEGDLSLNTGTATNVQDFSLLGAIHTGIADGGQRVGDKRAIQSASQVAAFSEATPYSTEKVRTVSLTGPLARHQYARRSTHAYTAHGRSQEPVVNDPVDHSVYFPIADYGEHYLGWLSQALGLPVA